jgi:hypothetical protein
MRISFFKSTPERRTHIAGIKTLFGEAYEARDRDDIPAYADRLGAIEIALAALDREMNDALACAGFETEPVRGLLSAQESAANTRRCRDVAWLDYLMRSLTKSATHQDNLLRLGFEVEMMGLLEGLPPELGAMV